MGKWAMRFLAALALLAAATPAAAQTRPRVAGSESSFSTGPTCVVNGIVSDCAGSAAPGVGPIGPGLVVAMVPVVGPVPGVGWGGAHGERASNDVDVERSSRGGTAVAR
jgi:hypothetical protein